VTFYQDIKKDAITYVPKIINYVPKGLYEEILILKNEPDFTPKGMEYPILAAKNQIKNRYFRLRRRMR